MREGIAECRFGSILLEPYVPIFIFQICDEVCHYLFVDQGINSFVKEDWAYYFQLWDDALYINFFRMQRQLFEYCWFGVAPNSVIDESI